MAERVLIEAKDIGRFLRYMALATCTSAEKGKKRPKDMVDDVEVAIALGLLMAQRQPELTEACAQYWSFTREPEPDKFVDSMLAVYQQMKAAGESGDKGA